MRKGPAATPLANSTTPISSETNASAGKDHGAAGAATATTKGKDEWDDNW
jgi:hypothetical protein